MGQRTEEAHHNLQMLTVQEAKNLKLGQMGCEHRSGSAATVHRFTFDQSLNKESRIAMIQALNSNTKILLFNTFGHIDTEQFPAASTYMPLVKGKIYYLHAETIYPAKIDPSGIDWSLMMYRGSGSLMEDV